MRRLILAIFIFLSFLTCAGVPMFDEAKANRAVAFFEYLKHTDGEFYNQPFVLLDWERQIIRDVYGTVNPDGTRQYRYVYIEIPKKNGKSELAAGAALYHLFADGEMNGEIYGCATDKKQAKIVYKVAKDMIDLVPALKKRARVTDSQKTITDKVTGSMYEVLSAEAFTKHGFKTSACIFDELHAQPNRDLWDVMTFEAGAARRQPIWWIITTAGDDPDRVSIGWEQHDYAMKVLAARNGTGDPSFDDPTWYVVIFNYEGDDIYNEANWFKANPSLGKAKSLQSMREAAQTAKLKPANERLFRWLDLNQWITTKLTTWLPLEAFDACAAKDWERGELAGKECFVGMDLSSTTDLTALVGVFPPQDGLSKWRVIWDAFIPKDNIEGRVRNDCVPYDVWAANNWITATEGNVVDYTEVKKRVLMWNTLYKIREVPCDRTFAAMLIQELEKEGLTCVDVPQTFASLTGPINQTEQLIRSGMIELEPSPVARWCFGNTSVVKNGNEQVKFVKEHRGKSVSRTKRIDTSVALVIAMARAQFYAGKIDLSSKILDPEWGM